MKMAEIASRIGKIVETVLGIDLPVSIRAWDGSSIIKHNSPTLSFNSLHAMRHLLWSPSELGLARAYISGAVDLEGDVFEFFHHVAGSLGAKRSLGARELASVIKDAIASGSLGPRPALPPEETRASRKGLRHSVRSDKKSISHHYDVGNDFYELILGPSMVYSCAYFDPVNATTTPLEQAQSAKLDLVCSKLDLTEGMRLLDVGCGWGSMVIHAAKHYNVKAVGITLSDEQARFARQRVVDEGLMDSVEIRVQDYREISDGPFDAISSIGMAEHVGRLQFQQYCEILYGLLRPGARLLNHQISRRPGPDQTSSAFIQRYVFPDGELLPLAHTVESLEAAGFEVRDIESLREHYALTLRQWVSNLENSWSQCAELVGEGRSRVWRTYMAGSVIAFEQNRIGLNQILAVKTEPTGDAHLPYRTRHWGV
jgi:cyclopropane-fatty-acyl-phospholipid synthase